MDKVMEDEEYFKLNKNNKYRLNKLGRYGVAEAIICFYVGVIVYGKQTVPPIAIKLFGLVLIFYGIGTIIVFIRTQIKLNKNHKKDAKRDREI